MGEKFRILLGSDEALSDVRLLQMREMWHARDPQRGREIGEPVHAFQACQFPIDGGIAGVLLAAPVDVAREEPGVELCGWDRAQEGLQMETPACLDIVQRPMLIDAVIAKQVVDELLDPGAFGRVGPGLGQALGEKPGSLCRVPGTSGFSDRFSCLVVLDPEKGTAGSGVDRALSSKTSV